jgi:hypothetical protein
MSQETYRKPGLDAESFQRLLASAFILQSRLDWISSKPIGTAEAKRFAPRVFDQKRTSSIRPSPRPAALGEANIVSNLSGAMFWNGVEALTIAIVICLMMGMSIHHLLAYRGRASSSGTPQTRDADRVTTPTSQVLLSSVLASTQQPATEKQSHEDGAGKVDVHDGDLVIHYRPRTAGLSSPIEKGMVSSSALARRSPRKGTQEATLVVTEKVVQYGDDVTMWSPLEHRHSLQPLSIANNRKSLYEQRNKSKVNMTGRNGSILPFSSE